eukprot:11643083-Alexandrium_andersonii.AAC.1
MPLERLTSPHAPAFQSFQASSPCRQAMMPCLRPSLWPKESQRAVKMTLEWPKLSKHASNCLLYTSDAADDM